MKNKDFVKIGEAAEILGVTVNTLRRWEETGLIRPTYTPGGTRLYSIEALEKLKNKPHNFLSMVTAPTAFKIAVFVLAVTFPVVIVLQVSIIQLLITPKANPIAATEDNFNLNSTTLQYNPNQSIPLNQRMAEIEKNNRQLVKEFSAVFSYHFEQSLFKNSRD